MIRILVFLLVLATGSVYAEIPKKAYDVAPVLVEVQEEYWSDMYLPYTLAGQIEQETCITLRHSKCWSTTAELKTTREYGFGLGQITTAYRADGTVRFNKFEELRAKHRQLRQYTWDQRFDPRFQVMAIVLDDRSLYLQINKIVSSEYNSLAMMYSAYNGGLSGLLKDRKICASTNNCDPNVWFDNVEHTSYKSKVPSAGYGKSFFEINREYVSNILTLRSEKYKGFWFTRGSSTARTALEASTTPCNRLPSCAVAGRCGFVN